MIGKHLASILLVFLLLGQASSQTMVPQTPSTPMPIAGHPTTIAPHPVGLPSGDMPLEGLVNQQGRMIEPLWVHAEYLLWWVRGANIPPLVAGSPPGTPVERAAILDGPDTTLLLGDDWVNGSMRQGFRLRLGGWIDAEQQYGIESSFFLLGAVGKSYQASGDATGLPLFGRPFLATDVSPAEGASALTSYPGIVSGSTRIHMGSANMLGADVILREKIWADCSDGSNCWRLDVLAGYRYLRYADHVRFLDDRMALGGLFEPGFRQILEEEFVAGNSFHGVTLGLGGFVQSGPWSITGQARLALGNVFRRVSITGTTINQPPGAATEILQGGLLALSSNSGVHRTRSASLVPELDLQVGYHIRENIRLYGGYSFLMWQRVARAAHQIDIRVDRNLIPPEQPGSTTLPAVLNDFTDLWAHGLTLGMEITY
jgi:hypothetical protein